MADTNAINVEMINPEGSTSKNTIISSDQICSTELLDSAVEGARQKQRTLVSATDSIIRLKKEVECEEKAAEQANEEGDTSLKDYLAEVDEHRQMQQHAKETNFMHAWKVCAQKVVLATETKKVHLHVSSLLDDGHKSLEVLDEMQRALEMRLTSALTKKELAAKKQLQIDAYSREERACHRIKMDRLLEVSNRLKQSEAEVSKLHVFLIERRHAINMLHREISDKCRDVNLLKKELDQGILQSGFSPAEHLS